jgi:hypothetical protein
MSSSEETTNDNSLQNKLETFCAAVTLDCAIGPQILELFFCDQIANFLRHFTLQKIFIQSHFFQVFEISKP